MKKNNSKIIQSFIEESAPRKQELTYGEGDNRLSFGVYPVLRLRDRGLMVKEIANGVFTDDAKTIATYHPELLEFMRRYATLKFFTDIKLPEQAEELWLFAKYTPVYDDVAAIVGEELNRIFDAADKIIDTRRLYLAHKTDFNSLVKTLGDSLSGLESKISKEDIDKIMGSLQGLSGKESIQKVIKSMLDSDKA